MALDAGPDTLPRRVYGTTVTLGVVAITACDGICDDVLQMS